MNWQTGENLLVDVVWGFACRLSLKSEEGCYLCAGLHLIKHAAWRTLERGGQFVLLGSAPDPKIQVCLQNGLSLVPVPCLACCFAQKLHSFLCRASMLGVVLM